MSDNVTTPAGQTTIVDTDRDRHHGGGCHQGHGFSVQPTVDLCGRGHGHGGRDGDFHILSGQQRESVQIGDSGRFSDAGDERLLKAIADVGERGADRSGAASLALLKALSDNEGRLAAALALTNKAREDDAKAFLREFADSRKEASDNKCELIKAAFENRLECKENALRVVEKINTGVDAVRHDLCKLSEKVGDRIDSFERRRMEDRIQTLEMRLRCDKHHGG